MPPSLMWKYFNRNEKTGVCVICSAEIKLSKSGSTFGLWQHLKGQHYLEYDTLENERENMTSKDAMGVLIDYNNPDLGIQSNEKDRAQNGASVIENMVPITLKLRMYEDWVKMAKSIWWEKDPSNNRN